MSKKPADINVLYVDDEEPNINVFRIAFKRRYKIFTAQSGEAALEVMASNDIHVVIADHRMPGMTGIELLSQIGDLYPKVYRIVISEYVNDAIIREAMKAYDFTGSMGKPWNGDELKVMIDKALEEDED